MAHDGARISIFSSHLSETMIFDYHLPLKSLFFQVFFHVVFLYHFFHGLSSFFMCFSKVISLFFCTFFVVYSFFSPTIFHVFLYQPDTLLALTGWFGTTGAPDVGIHHPLDLKRPKTGPSDQTTAGDIEP